MPKDFEYRAKDRYGLAQQGIITAESETAVATALRSKGYFITSIQEKQISIWKQDVTLFEKGITTADLALFARQFSVMIDAGMPLLSVLNVLIEQTEQKQMKAAVQAVLSDVQGGETLAQAMDKHPKVFPTIMVSLVEAGELGGVLNEVMDRLATHLEKEHKMIEKVKGAMTYPIVVLIVAALVVTGIITFILPTFEQMFMSAKMELPIMTQILLSLSKLFRNHYLVLLAMVCGLSWGIPKVLGLPQMQPVVDRAVLRLPIWGDISKKVAIARFCRTLSTLLHGGVNILPALDVVKKVAGNIVIANTVTNAQNSIKEGHGIAPQLLHSGVFPTMVVRMIAIGEESGELDKMLEKVADFFESEVEDKLNNFSKIIEPVLIVFLAVIIGFIVIAIMLPMFEISSAMR
jgi:type IV pilus assembly protein PilC